MTIRTSRSDMKTCIVCGDSKPLDEFYAHPRMPDGLLNKCKPCHKLHIRECRAQRPEYYRTYDRSRGRTPRRAATRSRHSRNYIERNPAKRAAVIAANNAVRDGRLQRQPCEVCGTNEQVEKHHDDYGRPLDVRWLCHPHHRAHHVALRRAAEQEAACQQQG